MIPVKQRRNRGRPWKPGQSGNPRGRPPKQESLTSLLKAELDKINPEDTEGRTWRELIVMATLKLAVAGNKTALKEVWDRSDGRVLKEIEVTENRTEPFVAEIVLVKPNHESEGTSDA